MRFSAIFGIFLMFISFQSISQKLFEQEVDSLKKLLLKTNSDKAKADLYIKIAQKYSIKDSLEAIKFAKKAKEIAREKNYKEILVDALEIDALIDLRVRNLENAKIKYKKLIKEARKIKYKKGEAQALHGLGLIAWYRTEYEKSLNFSQQALKIRQKIKDKKGIALSYNNLGVVYKNRGNYVAAIENYLKALKIEEELGNEQNLAKLYNNIGSIHSNQEQYKDALKYYFKSLKIKKKYGDTLSLSFTYNNIGEVYKKQNKLSKALDYYFKSLELKKLTKGQPTISMTYNNIGIAYKAQKKYQKAIIFYRKALDIAKKAEDRKEEGKALVFLGESYYTLKNYQEAIKYINQGIDLAKKYDTPLVLRDGAKILAETYKEIGKFDLAYQNYQLYVQMKDSLVNKEQTQKLTQLEANYEFSQQKDSLKHLQEKQELSLEEEKSKRRISEQRTLFSILLLVLLIIVSIIFFWYKQRHNRRLNEANRKLQNLNQELTQSQQAVQEQKEELRQNVEELQSTQETLERKQNQLKMAFSQNMSITNALDKSAIVSITDLEGNILKANDIFSKVSQYSHKELIGQNQNIVNSEYHPKEFWKEMWQTIENGKTWRAEVKNRAKNGSFYWVDTVINPIKDEKNKIYRYLSIRYLITERKEAENKIKAKNDEILRKNKKIEKTIQILSLFSKNEGLLTGDWKVVGVEASKVTVDALDIDACQLWYYNFKEKQMYCMGYYHKDSTKGVPLITKPEENPLFFEMLDNEEEFLMIHDINNDSQLKPSQKEYFIKQNYQSLLIYPLLVSSKQQGILVCFQEKPHIWENEDIMFLKSINDELLLTYQSYRREQAKEKIRKQSIEIREINDNLKESINYAQRIQKSILHTSQEIRQTLAESFIFFRPRDVVSGDFYFYTKAGYKIVIAAIDCTGHGIPGAFMSLIGNDLLYEIVKIKGITAPNTILDLLKEEVVRVLRQKETGNQDGMDAAICTIDSYPEELQEDLGLPMLQYSGAKNPLIFIQDGEMQIIKGDKITIGGIEKTNEEVRFTNHIIPLFQKTTFYIFSDGIQDQFGGKNNKKFSPKRLRNFLFENHQKSMDEQIRVLSNTLDNWQKEGKEEQVDDMLLIGVRV